MTTVNKISQLAKPTCAPSTCILRSRFNPFYGETIIAQCELNTDDLVHIWHHHNVSNRVPSDVNVKNIIQSIKKYGWLNTGEFLKFDTEGRLINGQHVIKALLEMEYTPVYHNVMVGLNEFVDELMSPPKQRHVRDIIQKYDPRVTMGEVSALKAIHLVLDTQSRLNNANCMDLWLQYGSAIRLACGWTKEMRQNLPTRQSNQWYRGFNPWRALCAYHQIGAAKYIFEIIAKPEYTSFSNELNKFLDKLPTMGRTHNEPFTNPNSFETVLIRGLCIAVDRVIAGKKLLWDSETSFYSAVYSRRNTQHISQTYRTFTGITLYDWSALENSLPIMERESGWRGKELMR